MNADVPPGRQLWLEFPPMSPSVAPRLLVFLHGAGSSPEAFAPVAIAWQLKFPGATAILLQGLQAAAEGDGHDWFDASGIAADRVDRIRRAALQVGERIAELQKTLGVDASRTIVIGFSQGATVALDLSRAHTRIASIVVSYAGQLASRLSAGERIDATIHLLHGGLDSLVPVEHARRALRELHAVGANATLDLTEEGGHTIGQDMIILGTTRAMQTVFQGRRRTTSGTSSRTLH